MEENPMTLGEIRISSEITENGQNDIGISLPDTTDVPMVTQLGMPELAKDALLNGIDEEPA